MADRVNLYGGYQDVLMDEQALVLFMLALQEGMNEHAEDPDWIDGPEEPDGEDENEHMLANAMFGMNNAGNVPDIPIIRPVQYADTVNAAEYLSHIGRCYDNCYFTTGEDCARCEIKSVIKSMQRHGNMRQTYIEMRNNALIRSEANRVMLQDPDWSTRAAEITHEQQQYRDRVAALPTDFRFYWGHDELVVNDIYSRKPSSKFSPNRFLHMHKVYSSMEPCELVRQLHKMYFCGAIGYVYQYAMSTAEYDVYDAQLTRRRVCAHGRDCVFLCEKIIDFLKLFKLERSMVTIRAIGRFSILDADFEPFIHPPPKQYDSCYGPVDDYDYGDE